MADIAQTEQSTHLLAPDNFPSPTPSNASQPAPENPQTDLHEPTDAHAPAATAAQPTDLAATNNATSATTATAAPPAGTQVATPVVAPAHVKKFTPVNATRKFLEKTSSSSAMPTSASSPATPGNKAPARSTATPSPTTAPPATTSSKLVSAKLSNMGSPSPGTPSTWGRAPSAAAAPSPSPADSPTPIRAQPQPADGAQRKRSASPNKPVWGTPTLPPAPTTVRQASSDFPTAAEAARGWRRNANAPVPPPPLEPSAEQIRSDAHKQAMAESAALFRGERLDPNVSHWDEMEDEEDFFQNPIEFGDGTQYKVDMPGDGEQQEAPSHDVAHPNGVAKEDEEGGWTQVTGKGGVATPSHAGSLSTTATATSVKTPSPVISPHETFPPRALYNDRSNRFEPYNGKPGRGGPGPYRRDSRLSDDGRDAPPHRSPTVQLLRHAPGEQQPAKSTGPIRTIPSVFDRVPPPHERGREPPPHGSGFRAPPHAGRRGTGDMGPPPPPSRRGTNDSGPPSAREAPPHLGRVTPVPNGRDSPVSTTSSRMSVRDRAPSVASSVTPMSIGKSAPEPVHDRPPTPAQPSTPAQPPAPVLSPDEQEELMKKYQHELAEKARKRRLEEEAERERAHDRARKKAAEMEERIAREKLEKEAASAKAEAERKEKAEAERKEKAEAEQKEKDRIEAERVAASASERSSRFDSIGSARGTTSFGRPRAPSDRTVGFQPAPPVRPPAAANPPPADPVMQLDSWRTNAAPPPPRPSRHKPEGSDATTKTPTPVSKPPPNFVTSLFTNDFSIKDEEVEVLDFSEISKLAPPEAAQSSADAPVSSPGPRQPIQLLQRPSIAKPAMGTTPIDRVALVPKSETNAWRKPLPELLHPVVGSDTVSPAGNSSAQPQQSSAPPPSVWARRGPPQDAAVAQRSTDPPTLAPIARSTESAVPTSPTSSPIRKHGRTSSTEQVSPRQVPYKEAPLSALTDTMSRIKGALAGMQDAKGKDTSSPSHSPESVSATFKASALSPGLRERESKGPTGQALPEFNSVSMQALVMTPEPGETSLLVRLPPVSRPRETATKKQIHLWSTPGLVRFDALTFDPPIKGMSRRAFVVEEVLFERAKVKQGTTLYRVALPSKRLVNPRVVSGADASERPSAGGFSSRPPLVGPQGKPPSTFGRATGGSLFGARSRGVDNASWRKPAAPTKLESAQTELNPVSRSPPPEPDSQIAQPATPSSGHRLGQAGEAPKTPPILSAHWGQTAMSMPIINSPSRQAPDPEHLKQVWSQTPDKDRKPSSNSLQGIADEPTRLSFSMQEMKSEDGETPPPTMSSSSHSATSITRMSVADAHRAFQQVPTPSSSSSSPKPPQRPSPLPSQAPSHLSASPGRPPPPAMPRIFYPHPPPGASHMPGPPHLYPMQPPAQQQEQRPPINGTTPHPQMAQGWVVGPAGAQQPPQQLLRPPHPGSPYPVQYVAYAPPGAMYGPHPGQSPHMLPKPGQPVPPLPLGAGRGRGMPMMSPVPGPAQPHISPIPTPGPIMPHMGMTPYPGGPIPSIYHMPPPGASRPMGQPQPPPPGQQMHMYPGGPQRPPVPQYPSGAFMHAPQPPFGRPNW